MQTMTIRWQRLVDRSGRTCERCGITHQELQRAVQSLKASLAPLGIQISLQERALSAEECAKDVSQSNRIWIQDRPLEDLLAADPGMNPCESCCGALGENVECRTLTIDGRTYEGIPAELIVRAGLVAASHMVGVPSSGQCCPPADDARGQDRPCCPDWGREKR